MVGTTTAEPMKKAKRRGLNKLSGLRNLVVDAKRLYELCRLRHPDPDA